MPCVTLSPAHFLDYPTLFEDLDLHRSLRLALEALPFKKPTEVQSQVVPQALDGIDLQVTAETGSGKTLAYLVPLIQRILTLDNKQTTGTLALVLVPTRELSRQVLKEARQLIKHSPLSAAGITGGADFKYQRALLRKDPEIVVGTPGRILEHCQKGSMSLESMTILVLDEADRMLDLGFRDDVMAVTQRSSHDRQILLLSATPGHGGVKQVARSLLPNAKHIALNAARKPHSAITHQMLLADSQEHKDKLLVALAGMEEYRRVLVFANKRISAVRLNNVLRTHQFRSAALHGEMRTEQRKHVVAQMQDNKIDILCASDVAARGLDIKAVDCVINYDVPRNGDDYLHRTGRTGRAGEQGIALSLVDASEWNLMISISRYLGLSFDRRSVSGLKARYNGPKRQKSDGRAAGKKKKRSEKSAKANATPGVKRSSKTDSKTRSQKKRGDLKSTPSSAPTNDGFAPLKKRPRQ